MSAPFDSDPTVDLTPAPAAPSKAVEVKVVVATVLATLLYGVLAAVQDNTEVLAFLPAWAQAIVVTVLPTLLGALAGYRVPSNRV